MHLILSILTKLKPISWDLWALSEHYTTNQHLEHKRIIKASCGLGTIW